MEIIIIAAVAENGVIGKDNALPWHLSDDLRHFKALTDGFPCIMGRKTYESLPKRPLPNRLNIVISASLAADALAGAVVARSLADAFRLCGDASRAFVCGGASIYADAIACADTLELTRVHRVVDGDTHFPAIDTGVWIETAHEAHEVFSFSTLHRRG